MPDYRITWEIDVFAPTPRDAARQAFGHMQRPGTTATVFDVADSRGNLTRVDLLDDAPAAPRPSLNLDTVRGFIEGFEGDELQEGIPQLLAAIDAATHAQAQALELLAWATGMADEAIRVRDIEDDEAEPTDPAVMDMHRAELARCERFLKSPPAAMASAAPPPDLIAAARETVAAWDMEEDTPEHNAEDRLEGGIAQLRAGLAAIAATAERFEVQPHQASHGADIAIVDTCTGEIVAIIPHDPALQTVENPDGETVVRDPADMKRAHMIAASLSADAARSATARAMAVAERGGE